MPQDSSVTPEEIKAMDLDATEVQLLELLRSSDDDYLWDDDKLAEAMGLPTFYVRDKSESLLPKLQAYGAKLDAVQYEPDLNVKRPHIDRCIREEVFLNQIFNSPN